MKQARNETILMMIFCIEITFAIIANIIITLENAKLTFSVSKKTHVSFLLKYEFCQTRIFILEKYTGEEQVY